MTPGTFKARHAAALLMPETPEERTIATLFIELSRLADRYKDDTVMIVVVEQLAEALVRLAGDGESGRIDPSLLQAKVRDVVERAGGHLA